MVDRIALALRINPLADEATNNASGPWKIELFRDRVETEYENPHGAIGEAYAHGEEVRPFDDIQVFTCEAPGEWRYNDIVRYLQKNPAKMLKLVFGADRPSVLRSLSFRIRRKTPFQEFERQEIPLAGLLSSRTQNDLTIDVPVEAILDGWTYLEISCKALPEDVETVTLIVETGGVADVRAEI